MSDALIPLYGFVRGDALGLLVLARESDTLGAVAASLAQAAEMRVKPCAVPVLCKNGAPLNARLTVREAGLRALDRVDLVPGETDGVS